jgi:hypothetical protein
MKEDRLLMYKGNVYLPKYQEPRYVVLKYMHNVPYARHLGYQKTIVFVRSQCFWPSMKKDVVDYIVISLECQKVKVEHKLPTELQNSLPIPGWKWEVVTIDFITKLSKTMKQDDSIIVVVDKLTKAIHFILVKVTHKETNIAEIYIKEIASLHGVPKEIVYDRDPKFTSNFWK